MHKDAGQNQAVKYLTVTRWQADYIYTQTHGRNRATGMSNKINPTNPDANPLKNESARQRWELFHRAIAHAKQSNVDALGESDDGSADSEPSTPYLYVAK